MIQVPPYRPRPIRFIELIPYQGWLIKLYGIREQDSGNQERPDPEVLAGHTQVLPHLPQPPVTDEHYGVGFLIVHQGVAANWYLLDWWYAQDIIKHKLFSSPGDAPTEISPAPTDLMACVWELAIHGFERQAWLDTILRNPKGPDLEAYLAKRMNEDV